MASSLTPRNPYQMKKENLGLVRRGPGFKVAPPRNVLSAINNGAASDGASSVDGGTAPPPVIEFSGREDVERLLAEKMKGKLSVMYTINPKAVEGNRAKWM